MDFKKLSKRMLSIMLAFVMALPMVVIAPVSAAANTGQISPFVEPMMSALVADATATGRNTMLVNGFRATIDDVSGDGAILTVVFAGNYALPSGAYFIVYARAGSAITNIHRVVSANNATLTFTPAPTEAVSLYLGIMSAPIANDATGVGFELNGISLSVDASLAGNDVTFAYTIGDNLLRGQRSGQLTLWFTQNTPTTLLPAAAVFSYRIVAGQDLDLGGTFTTTGLLTPTYVLVAQFAPDAPPEVPEFPDYFFYRIDYANERVYFGHIFDVWTRPVVGDNGRAAREPVWTTRARDDDAVFEDVRRSQITVIFNRRADNIRTDRGNWSTVGRDGGFQLTAGQARTGGWVGVRKSHLGQHQLIGLIEITPRANNRGADGIRDFRRTVFRPTIATVGADGAVSALTDGNVFQNQHATMPVEINVTNRGMLLRSFTLQPGANPSPTANSAYGSELEWNHDEIPRGTRGTFRIASAEADSVVYYDGRDWSVRDLIAKYGTTALPVIDGRTIELGEGRFASATVAFRVPNQPAAPNRMLLTMGRNGAANFISRTNVRMYVNVGVADGAAAHTAWRRLNRNVTLHDLNSIFGAQPLQTGRTDEDLVFEFRTIRNNRIVSAPGFVEMSRQSMNAYMLMSATVAARNLGRPDGGSGNVIAQVDRNLPNNNANMRLTVTTVGGRMPVRPATYNIGDAPGVRPGDVVTGWFGSYVAGDWTPHFPAGMVATVRSVSGANIVIQINATTPAEGPDEGFSGAVQLRIPGNVTPAGIPYIVVSNPDGRAAWHIRHACGNVECDCHTCYFGDNPVCGVTECTHAGCDEVHECGDCAACFVECDSDCDEYGCRGFGNCADPCVCDCAPVDPIAAARINLGDGITAAEADLVDIQFSDLPIDQIFGYFWTYAARDTFQAAIDAAGVVYANSDATLPDLEGAISTLEAAHVAFGAARQTGGLTDPPV